MSEQQRQHLSAFVDGEIDPALGHAALSALESNAGLKAAWESYHLIGAVIRSEPVGAEYRGIAGRVSERVRREPSPLHKARGRQSRASRIGAFVGAAVAAGAAFLAVFAVPQLFAPETDIEMPPTHRTAAAPPAQFRLASPSLRWHVDEPALENKLDRFLVDHQEQSPASGVKGFLPYTTLVGYEARP